MGSLLSTGLSALTSYQQVLNTTGHNIANANTPGYSRQTVDLEARQPEFEGVGWIGQGVATAGIRRSYDQFLAGQVRATTSSAADLEAYYGLAAQLDDLVANPELGLDPVMQRFFDALQELADDPSSVAARQVVLAEANALTDRFQFIDARLDDVQAQLNSEVRDSVNEINALAEGIAALNVAIVESRGQSNGRRANDLLDQRDQLLFELSERVAVNVVEQEDGAMNVFIGKGQAIVMAGQAASMGVQPGNPDVAALDVTLDLGFGPQVITSQMSGGSVGGMIRFRGELLDQTQSRLGLIAVGLAEQVNAAHALGLDLDGDFGGDFFNSPKGQVQTDGGNTGTGSVTLDYANVANLATSNYRLDYAGSNNYTLTRISDGATTAIATGGTSPYTTAEIDGFTLTITGGAIADDSFLLLPAREAARDISVAVEQVQDIAAAGPLRAGEALNANGAPINAGDGRITQPLVSTITGLPLSGSGGNLVLTFSNDVDGLGNPGFAVSGAVSTTLLYDPATEDRGKTFTLTGAGDATFTLSGVPAAGDQFLVSDNTDGSGDNRNAALLAGLQNTKVLFGNHATLQAGYAQLVSDVGAKTSEARLGAEAQAGLQRSAEAAHLEVSGVNLDEEAAKLLQFQQAYQAAAQVISVSQTLFDTLLGSVRG